MQRSAEQRFCEKLDKSGGLDACWPWIAGCDPSGYGAFGLTGGKKVNSHVFAYELANGPVPEGLEVRHTCDNRPCCNPRHLLVGTRKQNMEDAVERNRLNPLRGSEHPKSVLTESDVRDIRDALAAGDSCHGLARQYGVHHTLISKINRNKTWKHVS